MRTLPKEPTPFCGRFLAFSNTSALYIVKLVANLSSSGSFSAGFTLERAIKNGVRCGSEERYRPEMESEKQFCGQIRPGFQSSPLRIAGNLKQVIVAVEFTLATNDRAACRLVIPRNACSVPVKMPAITR